MYSKYFFIFFIIVFLGGIFFIPNKLFAQQTETVWVCNANTTGNIYNTKENCDKTCFVGFAQSQCVSTTRQFSEPWWTCSVTGQIFNTKTACICNVGFEKRACISSTGESDILPPPPPPPPHDDQLFIKFLNWLFPALLSVAAILAFLKIVFAGFKWIAVAGDPNKIADAKDAILKAVLGLALAFVAWLILWTINPALVGLSSGIPATAPGASPPTAPGASPPVAGTPTDLLSEQEARNKLADAGISVNKSPCPAGVRYQDVSGGCTSLEGIPAYVVDNLVLIKAATEANCGCTINMVITGGTELGHETHGPGIPIVDLRFDEVLGNYLVNNAPSLGISSICTDALHQGPPVSVVDYSFNCSHIESEEHLHVVF